jgi:predicted nuclease of predicted toxin-antitoxin system
VRFLIDAQLPRRLVAVLRQRGHDAVHTLDLPQGNRTPDDRLCDLCHSDERVLISKDRDFVDSHLLQGRPARLLHVSTGNITNLELEQLLSMHDPDIVAAFRHARYVELCRLGLIVHE